MTFPIYFLLFAFILLSLIIYTIITSPELFSIALNPTINYEIEKDLSQSVNLSVSADESLKSNFKADYKTENTTEVDIELQIKKQSRQLRRNLKTLNYISIIEARPHMIKNKQRLEEIKNLKDSLQREIIRNTKLLNDYRSHSH